MTYRSDAFYMGSFMGRHCLNGDNERIESLEFPVEAFKDFLRAERMPLPDFWQTKTGSTDGHIKPAQAVCPVMAVPTLPTECREIEAPKAPAAAPSVVSDIDAPGAELLTDEHEIVPGITVGDVRAMIDANSPAYCPRLLAAIQTKKDLMPNEALMENESAYNRMAKRKAIPILMQLGVENPKEKGKPADLDVNAVGRVLCRTRKKLEGRPKNS